MSGAVLSMAVSRPVVACPPLVRRPLLKQRATRLLQSPPLLVQDPPGQPSVCISTEQLKVGPKRTVPELPSITVFGGRHYMSLSPDVERRSPSSWQWQTSLWGNLSVSPVALFRLQLIAEQVGPHEVLKDTPLKVSSV